MNKQIAIFLTINGDKSGLLIGRKGRTLDALQFIVNKIVSKTLEKRIKIVVDSENYRQRRHDRSRGQSCAATEAGRYRPY